MPEKTEVELVSRGDACYIFMTPDADWLNDASRVYPITIDPQVTISSNAQNIIDNYVMENSGMQTYTLDKLLIGKNRYPRPALDVPTLVLNGLADARRAF